MEGEEIFRYPLCRQRVQVPESGFKPIRQGVEATYSQREGQIRQGQIIVLPGSISAGFEYPRADLPWSAITNL